jgi:hypothetical protein
MEESGKNKAKRMYETVSLKGSEVTAESSVSREPTKIGALLAVNYSSGYRNNIETVTNKFSMFEYKIEM